jgi:hypothetical protein
MDAQSQEQMVLSRVKQGYAFSGIVLAAEAGVPLRVIYRVACDANWRTRMCAIEQIFGAERKSLLLERRGNHWLVNGARDPALDGCSDVDLGLSPSTNTLAINRLGLGVRGRGEIKAAWVRFPGLDVVPAAQSYQRLSKRRYLYRNLGSDFKAVLDIDDAGLVVLYEGIWQRIAFAPGDSRSGTI